MGDQRLWLMTAKGPTLHFHGVTLGKEFPILAGSSSLCLQKLPGQSGAGWGWTGGRVKGIAAR